MCVCDFFFSKKQKVDTNFGEFRFASKDNRWISPMYGRDTFKYDLGIFSEDDETLKAYQDAFCELTLKYDGRKKKTQRKKNGSDTRFDF